MKEIEENSIYKKKNEKIEGCIYKEEQKSFCI